MRITSRYRALTLGRLVGPSLEPTERVAIRFPERNQTIEHFGHLLAFEESILKNSRG